jgi:hypothetical protein
VPSILVEMKNYLLHQDAWQQEGIFRYPSALSYMQRRVRPPPFCIFSHGADAVATTRLAGEASDIKQLKQQMNKLKRLDVSTNPDINAIANLLKVCAAPSLKPTLALF